jgi:DNA invertase Pin-like site-specific DNA recombinase
MKNIAIYYRVSTEAQDIQSQKHAVEKWLADQSYETCEVYTDVGSGKKDDRPQYQTMLHAAMSGEHDTIVVYKLDRFSRSAISAIQTILELWKYKIVFISVTQPAISFGDNNPFRNTLLAAFADVAELERETIVARIKDGIAAYKARNGGNWTRRSKLSAQDRADMLTAVNNGVSRKTLVRKYQISHMYLSILIRAQRRIESEKATATN